MSLEWGAEDGAEERHLQTQDQLQSWGLHRISQTSFVKCPPPEETPMGTMEELLSKYVRRIQNVQNKRVNCGEGRALFLLASVCGLKIWWLTKTFSFTVCIWFSRLKGRGMCLILKDCLVLFSQTPHYPREPNGHELKNRKDLIFLLLHAYLTGIKHGDI